MRRFHINKIYIAPLLLVLTLLLVGCSINNREPAAPGSIADTGGTASEDGTSAAPTDTVAAPTATPTEISVTPTATEEGQPTSPTAQPTTDTTQPTATATPPTTTNPTATPPPVPPPTGGERVHTVSQGENLFRIALRYNLDYITLARYNGIVNPHLIYVGQKIRIPGTGTTPPGGAQYHIVRAGETLAIIANRYNTTISAIAAANNIANRNLIYVGQRLLIP